MKVRANDVLERQHQGYNKLCRVLQVNIKAPDGRKWAIIQTITNGTTVSVLMENLENENRYRHLEHR